MTFTTREEYLGPDANFVMRGRSLDEIREFVERIDSRLRAIHEAAEHELRDKSPAERDAFDHGMRMRDEATAHIEWAERVRTQYESHPRSVEQAFGSGSGGWDVRAGVRVSDVVRMSDQQVRDAALRVLESRGRSLSPAQGDRVDTLIRTALSADNRDMDGAALARRLVVSESPAYRSAWHQIMTQPHPILTGEEAEAVRALQRLEYRAMSEGSGPVGAYGLPVLIDPSILLASGADATPILDIARVVPTNTNVWKGVASPPPQFSWDAEGSVVSDDSPTLAQPAITVYTMRGFIPYSIELGQDYPSFASEMQALLAAGYQDLMAQTLAVGTGSNQPFGAFTKLDTIPGSEVLITTAGQLGAQDIFKVWNGLPERFRSRSSWVMNVSTESLIRSFSSPTSTSSFFTST